MDIVTKDERKEGFAPVYSEDSRVLILGSFPSVKSRKISFYYGNPQNAFWRTVCGYFGDAVPQTTEGKIAFLQQRRIALWDIVTSCRIEGSSDSSIAEEELADVPALLERTQIKHVLCNGTTAYNLTLKAYPALGPLLLKLPSTSPANPRFREAVWRAAFDGIFSDK